MSERPIRCNCCITCEFSYDYSVPTNPINFTLMISSVILTLRFRQIPFELLLQSNDLCLRSLHNSCETLEYISSIPSMYCE